MEWATLPLKRYAEFTGRSRRKEYWTFFLLVLVSSFVIGTIEGMLGLSGMIGSYGPLSWLFMLAVLVPSIAVGIRRLHDIGKTGWLILLGLIPFVGFLILIYFFVQESQPGPNEYGPDPLEGERSAAPTTM